MQIFIDDGKNKRGFWTSPRKVLSIENDAAMITVPRRAGETVSAAKEDARAALDESQFTSSIQESIDELDFNLTTEICHLKNNSEMSENSDSNTSEKNDKTI